MNCGRCGLVLTPGTSHAKEGDCIDALRHALSEATVCQTCGTAVNLVVHPACVAKQGARMAVDKAVDKGVEKILDTLFSPGKKPPSGGRKFEP